jgi:hypothetical protein
MNTKIQPIDFIEENGVDEKNIPEDKKKENLIINEPINSNLEIIFRSILSAAGLVGFLLYFKHIYDS